jgi:thymidylate synthase
MSNNLDKQYTILLQDILDNGVTKQTRNGEVLSVFGRQIKHNMSDGFPLLTGKKMFFKGIVTELLWFLRGDTNIKYLVDNDCHIWDGDAYKNYEKTIIQSHKENGLEGFEYLNKESFIERIETDDEFAQKWGELGPIYGKQWRDWGSKRVSKRFYDKKIPYSKFVQEGGIDQIANLINDLKNNPDSRRLMVNVWNVGELDQMVLPPCHYGFQVYTRELSAKERWDWYGKNGGPMGEQKLVALIVHENEEDNSHIHSWLKTWAPNVPTRAISLMWNQRSVDTFLGLPFNIASYGLLLEIIAKEVNMVPDELIGNLGDVHLYSNHIEQAKEQIGREPYPLPKLLFKDHLKSFDTIIDILRVQDFILDNYQSHPSIKAPLSN